MWRKPCGFDSRPGHQFMNPTIALIQKQVESDNPQINLADFLDDVFHAVKNGANIICVSELFSNPYFCQHNDEKILKLAEPIPGPVTETLSHAAKSNKIYLIASVYELAGNQRYNTALAFSPEGKIILKYRKIHIPDDPRNHYSEKFYFAPGDLGYPVVDTPYGKIGVLVCFDQWFPEAARQLALKGAEIIFYPTAIGWPNSERDMEIGQAERQAWITMQRAHAIANGVFVAACNRVGHEDKIQFWGTSFIADPMGRILHQSPSDKEDVTCVKLDRTRIAEIRKDWPFLDYFPQ